MSAEQIQFLGKKTLRIATCFVEGMADLETPVGSELAEALGIVSIEVISLEERPGPNVK